MAFGLAPISLALAFPFLALWKETSTVLAEVLFSLDFMTNPAMWKQTLTNKTNNINIVLGRMWWTLAPDTDEQTNDISMQNHDLVSANGHVYKHFKLNNYVYSFRGKWGKCSSSLKIARRQNCQTAKSH
jgi:hypothetical protein